LITLKCPLPDLHLQAAFKSLDVLGFQGLHLILDPIHLLFHFFEPLVDGGFEFTRVTSEGSGGFLKTWRGSGLGGLELMELVIEVFLEG
jgi:hypothetical protein